MSNTTPPEKWTPPENPDPLKVLSEAHQDAREGRYADSLEKYTWFQENATEIDSALAGVKSSYALQGWAQLARVYQPALASLRVRASFMEGDIIDMNGPLSVQEKVVQFIYFATICRLLGDVRRTINLFSWIGDHFDHPTAKLFYSSAEPDLVEHGEFELCGKYIDADADLGEMISSYQWGTDLNAKNNRSKTVAEALRKILVKNAALLVRVLVGTDRNGEALAVVERVEGIITDGELTARLRAALRGGLWR